MRYIEHPDQDLDPRGFQPLGTMRLYGKSSPPPEPDLIGAARETAAGNQANERASTRANRINQYTPYGSLTYSQTPTKTYNYEGYNKALDAYNAPSGGAGQSYTADAAGNVVYTGQNAPASKVRPDLESFATVDPDSGWQQNMNLTPEAQAALDQELSLNRKYGEVANLGFDRARSIFENPQLDMSGVPQRAINVGQTAQDAILSRLNPQLARQDEELRTRMANQGITLGSQAYGQEMNQQGQQANDLRMQAALRGIDLDQQNRASALQEQAYLQDRPLNLVNALKSGNQVQAPQFQKFAQQAATAGPDILGATQGQYQNQLSNYNAQQAQGGGMMSGLLGIGMGLAGMPGAGGSILQGAKGLFR